jgi:hypothetical protein
MTRESLPESCSLPSNAERVQAVEAVREDPGLTTQEKELSITTAKDQDYCRVYSEIGSITRRLLCHQHVRIEEVRISDDDRFGARFDWDEWKADQGPITGVKAYVPVGLVKIGAKPRSNNQLNRIVSDHNPESNGGESR